MRRLAILVTFLFLASALAHADSILVSDGSSLWTVDRTTGTLSNQVALNLNGQTLFAMAFQPGTGTLYGIAGDQLFTIDPNSGNSTVVPGFSGAPSSSPLDIMGPVDAMDLTFDASGNLYALLDGELYGIGITTPSTVDLGSVRGAASSSASGQPFNNATALAPSATGTSLTTFVLDGPAQYFGSLDQVSGVFQFEAGVSQPPGFVFTLDLSASDNQLYGLAPCPSGGGVGSSGPSIRTVPVPGSLPTLDPAGNMNAAPSSSSSPCAQSGGATLFFSLDENGLTAQYISLEMDSLTSLAIQPDASSPSFVPEPASLALFALGSGALAYFRRRKAARQ